jgi:hypothetical protein
MFIPQPLSSSSPQTISLPYPWPYLFKFKNRSENKGGLELTQKKFVMQFVVFDNSHVPERISL